MIIVFPRHKLSRCRRRECEGCGICRGGLALCVTCGGAEASLPRDCPGRRMSLVEQAMVQDGVLDYARGRGWHNPRTWGRGRSGQ